MSSDSRQKVGVLLALNDDGNLSSSISPITIYMGLNAVGRGDLPNELKQISRKHITLSSSSDGSVEVCVEGQNPVVVRSSLGRRKCLPQSKTSLHTGDIIELLPGKLPFRYEQVFPESIAETPMNMFNSSWSTEGSSDQHKNAPLEESPRKRQRQIKEDEEFAMALQALENEKSSDEAVKASSLSDMIINGTLRREHSLIGGYNFLNPDTESESIDACTHTFHLLQVKDLPNWANARCVRIEEVIQGDILVAVLSNYMVDIDWLLSVCPCLGSISRVVMIHGESGLVLEHLQVTKPSNWLLYKPPLRISYGTHHSKAMLLIYPTGVRVVVHTANLIYVDWNNKTQGLWMQDFPYKDSTKLGLTSAFENDLVEYLQALEWRGCSICTHEAGEMKINAQFFRKFDFSMASVRLVASVPGYHQGQHLTRWGHMKLRSILQDEVFEEQFQNSSLVYQFSSLGSLDEKWMSEFASSTSAGLMPDRKSLGPGEVRIIWPTVEDVRWSLEGYAAGNALPSPAKNVDKSFLTKYWARWQAELTGRSRAMPHIKTYVRYKGQSLAYVQWLLLTSANLSKAAWGALQKNGSQFMIRSYELGVCFLPSLLKLPLTSFSCTKKDTRSLAIKESKIDDKVAPWLNIKLGSLKWHHEDINSPDPHVILPVPYKLPPPKYGANDKPWSWDKHYYQPDVFGKLWPRSVQLYTDLSVARFTED